MVEEVIFRCVDEGIPVTLRPVSPFLEEAISLLRKSEVTSCSGCNELNESTITPFKFIWILHFVLSFI